MHSQTAQTRYEQLRSDRDYYLDRARVCARLTLPYLIPTNTEPTTGNKESYPVPWNGIGARGVGNLASRILLALLPPTQQFFRFSLDEGELAKQNVSPEEKSGLEEALSKIERMVLREIEASNDRVVFHEALLHLLVAGNCLLYIAPEGLRVFHLNRYVCSRGPMGNPVEAVTCEELPIHLLPDAVQQMLKEDDALVNQLLPDEDPIPEKPQDEETVKIYTYIQWSERTVKWHQEVKGQLIPGSEGTSPVDLCPWLPLRMGVVDGQPYGPSYVEQAALADLQTVEALCQAIAEGSLAGAKLLFLVKPSGVTKAADLANAPNGSFVTGDPNDVLALQAQKSTDLAVAMQGKQQIEARLSQAFMLADVRDSERTTAEEVRLQAMQIEQSLGSVYALLTQEFQVPYVAKKLDILVSEGKVPEMPKELVKPVMTVGLAAVGRGNDLENLVRFTTTLGQTMGPETLATFVKPNELITRLAYSMGIDTLGLVKTEAELQAEQQQQQEMAMRSELLNAGAGDPQKLANAAATAQQMQQPESQPQPTNQ